MSGHSKWANIKVRKGAQDKKRSEAFTKMAKLILGAIRQGGGNTNPETNTFLKGAMDRAREVNMPKDNVERLLKRFEERKASVISVVLEGFGPFGVPLVIETETDNKNRILGEVKGILHKFGGDLGQSGSVMYLFERKGQVELASELNDEMQLAAIDWGASEIDGRFVTTKSDDLNNFVVQAKSGGVGVVESKIVLECKNPVSVDEIQLEQVIDLVEQLEELEDVINVYPGLETATNA